MEISPFRLERFFAQHEFSVAHLLCSSDCESLSIRELLSFEEGADTRFADLRLGYTESKGHPLLRAQIASTYDAGLLTAEQVLVHAGAQEAIFNFMQVALKPGDHLVVQFPAYQSLYEVARSLGVQVTLWQGSFARGWKPDLSELPHLLQPNTRGIVINSPHNPTGQNFTRPELDTVVEIARARGLWLFSDEVYRELEYDPASRLPAACELYENALSLGVLSKSYGLAGLRIGWLATRNADWLRKLATFKDFTTICSSGPSEFLATLAITHRDRIIARNRAIIAANLAVLDELFAQRVDLIEWVRPTAGPIAFPRLRDGSDAEALSQKLIKQAQVLILPGKYFEAELSNIAATDLRACFRLGFGRKDFAQALERFERVLVES